MQSTDSIGNTSVSADMQFTTDAAGAPSDIASDEFNGASLDTSVWTFVDPVGDCSVSMTGSQVSINASAGVDHDVWTSGLRAPHIEQEVSNADFFVEFKMDSLPSERYQLQGLVVKQDANNFLRFGSYSTGSRLKMFVAAIHDGSSTVHFNKKVNLTAPYYMRVQRTGDTWTQSYSDDGVSWTTGGVIGHDVMTMTSLGLYGGNAQGASSPAHSGLFDYFHEIGGSLAARFGPLACSTDLTADGVTDVRDLLIMLRLWGSTTEPGADLNHNGAVDVGDLLLLLSEWGGCP